MVNPSHRDNTTKQHCFPLSKPFTPSVLTECFWGGEKNKRSRLFLEKANSLEKKLDKNNTPVMEGDLKKIFYLRTILVLQLRKDNRPVFISQVQRSRVGCGESQSLRFWWKETAFARICTSSCPSGPLLSSILSIMCFNVTSECLFAKTQSSHSRFVCPTQSKLYSFCIPMLPLGEL